MANVELKNLTKKFGDVIAVQNMDLSIPHNEFLVLVGPSGCGKSTTLRMIAGLEEITSGEIYIGDQLVNEKDPKDRNVSMVFQNYALYPHMTVKENLGFSLKIAKVDKKEIEQRVKEAVQILGLEELQKRKPSQLSGGQRQRVAMGRAIVRNPKVFLFDEPLSNLDAQLRGQVRIEIKKLQRSMNVTSVFVTHDQVEAMTLGDRLAVINNGIIEQIGTPIEVYETPKTLFVAEFIGTPKMNFINGKIKNQKFVAGKTEVSLNNLPDNDEAILGFRPEDLIVDNNGKFLLNVEIIEKLGADSLIYGADQNQNLLCLRVNGNTKINVNEKINLSVPEDKYHFFDATNNIRLN